MPPAWRPVLAVAGAAANGRGRRFRGGCRGRRGFRGRAQHLLLGFGDGPLRRRRRGFLRRLGGRGLLRGVGLRVGLRPRCGSRPSARRPWRVRSSMRRPSPARPSAAPPWPRRRDAHRLSRHRPSPRRPGAGLALAASGFPLSFRRLTNLPSSTGGIFTATSSPSGFGSLSRSIGTNTAAPSASTMAPTRRRRARRRRSSTLTSSAEAVMAEDPDARYRPRARAARQQR